MAERPGEGPNQPRDAQDARTSSSEQTASRPQHPAGEDETASLAAESTGTWDAASPARPQVDQIPLPSIPGYEVERVLGRGGMGIVLLATDPRLRRRVAIKLPLAERFDGADDRERFLREARAAARLRHANICSIYEIGEIAGGLPYLALAYVDGPTLGNWAASESPSAHESATMVAKLAAAVGYAHGQGLVHRDIKPGNVLVEPGTNEPILMDFGLAKDLTSSDVELTHSGAILGTPAYMAPEQAAGRLEQVGPTSDVYALGAVLYALICGQPPFLGGFGEILRRVQTDEPPSPRRLRRGLHRDLETICLKAMAKAPADRYASAEALADDLRRFTRGESILARPDRWPKRLARLARRRPLLVVGTLAAAAVLTTATLLLSQASRRQAIAQSTQQIAGKLAQGNWTPERFQQVRDDIVLLRPLSATAADSAERQLRERYAEHVRGLIARPALPPDLVARIEQELEFVRSYSPESAQELESELTRALRSWGPLFDLRAPAENVGAVFDPAQFTARNGVLQAGTASAPAGPLPPDEDSSPASSPSRPRSAHLPTKVPSVGNVEVRAEFRAEALRGASELGVAFGAPAAAGTPDYAFVVTLRDERTSSGDPEVARPADLESAWLGRHAVTLRIVRSGVTVRDQSLFLPYPPVRIAARREGTRLSVQVNESSPLVFDDLLPLRDFGAFAVVAPEGARLDRIAASRQLLPDSPSPLERGDFLFAQGEHLEALESFRAQELGATEDVRQEARFKQGLCLVQLNRRGEAIALLTALSAEPGDRWPLAAACHLWLALVAERRRDEAEVIVESLAARYDFEDLALLLPSGLRGALLKEYSEATRGAGLVTFDDAQFERLRRNLKVERLLEGEESHSTQVSLLRGLRMLRQREEAIELATRVIHSPRFQELSSYDRIWMIEECCWELRLHGRAQSALALANEFLEAPDAAWSAAHRSLLVERARCHAGQGRWGEAERDLDELLREVPTQELQYRHYSAAHLLLGYCRRERGDEQGALAAWRHGLYREWRAQVVSQPGAMDDVLLPEVIADNRHQFSGLEMVQFLMLASLSGELSDDESQRVLLWIGREAAGRGRLDVLNTLTNLLQGDFALTLLRGLCKSERGERVARGVALQTLDLPDVSQFPMFLAGYEAGRQGAFPELDAEQDEFLWELVVECYRAATEGTVSKTQVVFIALAWKGTSGPLGWQGVASGLEPTFRGRLAYLMGKRFERLGREEATMFYRTAVADSPPNSPAAKLAAVELARLAAPVTAAPRP